MFAGKKSAQIREILISESAWEEMTCLFAPSLAIQENDRRENSVKVAEKLSERLHITFKVPTWLIALIVVMIVINVIVLIVLHR